MKLLLDTQAFLWFVTDDNRLSVSAKAAIEDPANDRFLSIASIWEMAIRNSIGKLNFTEPFAVFIPRETTANSISLLAITSEHAMAVALLPLHHRDPFDRLIVVQAATEKLRVVSSDEFLERYPN